MKILLLGLAFGLILAGILTKSNEYQIRNSFSKILFFIGAAISFAAAIFKFSK